MSSMKCDHKSFKHTMRMMYSDMSTFNIRQMYLLLKIECSICGDPFTFKVRPGVSLSEALSTPDGTELRIPMNFPDSGEDLDDFDSGPETDEDVH